jgi:hypothetical protein
MSGLTLPQLLDADPAPFDRAAATWEQLAEELDTAAEGLIQQARNLEYAWPSGSASDAAHTEAGRIRTEVSNTYNPARRISQALRQHAEAMRGYLGQAHQIVAEARNAGYLVDPAAGTVTASAGHFGSMDSRAANIDAINRQAQRYADELAAVLSQARAKDDSTANAVNVNLPDTRTGFGSLPPREISRQELESQRGRSAQQVNEWWKTLTPEQQEQAIARFPELVGWLDGVPAVDRDAANRLSVDRQQDDLQNRENQIAERLAELRANPGNSLAEQAAADHERDLLNNELSRINGEQSNLEKVEATLARLGDRGLLLGIDPAGDGKAIIAVGNPDTATHTAVWVPGTGTDLGRVGADVNRVENLQREADRLTPESGDVSAIMWLGYDAPEKDLSAALGGRAREGGQELAPFIDGLRTTHEGGAGQHLTAVGHSYGSTVLGEAALLGSGLAVDDVVTAGSPGVKATQAIELGMAGGHVWAGSAAEDPITEPRDHHGRYVDWIPGIGPPLVDAYDDAHGPSPHEEHFGANRFHVDTTGHSAYWTDGSQSLENQARIVVGDYDRVGLDHGQAPPDWQGQP